jgi:hypothetical protein
MNNEQRARKKKPRRRCRRGQIATQMKASGGETQHWLPFIAFSVQFATEFTSRAAPRTVLHAAVASAAVISAAVTSF